jgi:uncharacterized protein involved in exopolysaccharide biosynthesis
VNDDEDDIGSNEGAASGSGGGPDNRRILAGLFRRVPLIVACTLTAGTALVFSVLQTKQYMADASLFRDPGFDQRVLSHRALKRPDPSREVATNIALISQKVSRTARRRTLGPG